MPGSLHTGQKRALETIHNRTNLKLENFNFNQGSSVLAWLGFKKTLVIGADLSAVTIKLLAIEATADGHIIKNYGVKPMPSGAMHENEIIDVEQVAEAIKQAWLEFGFKNREVALAIPSSMAVSKIVSMPEGLTDEELESQLQLELGKHIPYDVDEVNFDFQVLSENESNPNLVDVMLIVARKDAVEKRVEVFEKAGLSVKYVDVDGLAMERCFEYLPIAESSDPEAIYAIIDIGAHTTSITVIQDNQTVYTRDQNFGGMKLTEAIQQHYSLSFEESGALKHAQEKPEDYASEVLAPFRETLLQEIKTGLDFFYSTTEYAKVDKIFLAGATLQHEGVTSFITEGFEEAVETVNPIKRFKVDKSIDVAHLTNDAQGLMVVCGLAWRSFV